MESWDCRGERRGGAEEAPPRAGKGFVMALGLWGRGRVRRTNPPHIGNGKGLVSGWQRTGKGLANLEAAGRPILERKKGLGILGKFRSQNGGRKEVPKMGLERERNSMTNFWAILDIDFPSIFQSFLGWDFQGIFLDSKNPPKVLSGIGGIGGIGRAGRSERRKKAIKGEEGKRRVGRGASLAS